ncbi:MAG: RDD family protein [Alphaproteobacteria bacterium]|nr:RDD family protein [Alphaproteobacteria bacterium]
MTENLPSPSLLVRFDPLAFDGVLWRRSLAYLIDLIFILLLMLPFGLLLFLGGIVTLGLLWAPLPFLGITLGLCYHTLLVGGAKSSTWGQRLMGLGVATIEGQQPNMVQAFVQVLLFYATVTVATPLILLVGLFNAKGRLIQDMLSTLVVLKRG